jgi:RNA polymerase sigma-70 factor (ECF subfamily)
MQAESFDQVMAALRPRLHRYCARMIGSALEGEDIVQDALAKAAELYPASGPIARPEAWLFRIAHTTALDALRRRKRQRSRETEIPLAALPDQSAAADARVIAASGLAALLRLSPTQRSAIVLADVLGHSLVETAAIIETSLAAVKAALHRGRAKLRAPEPETPPPALDAAEREKLRAYADRFNARDFEALKALLAEDVRLDLVNRVKLAGRKEVAVYFTRYSAAQAWLVRPGRIEGRLALLFEDPAAPAAGIHHIVLLGWAGAAVATIRDFLYAPYVMDGLAVERL